MNEKNNDIHKIIEKVTLKKIVDIMYYKPKEKKLKSHVILDTLLFLSSVFSPIFFFIFLINKPNDMNTFETIIFFIGAFFLVAYVSLFLSITYNFIKCFYDNKDDKNFICKIKKSYYNLKLKSKIIYNNTYDKDISYDLYKEISQHFNEDEMIKIVKIKLKNKDLCITPLYERYDKNKKREKTNINQKQKTLADKFTKSLYER